VIRHRSVGLVGVLPVYVALATALGFVDFRVRTHHERDLAYTASVVAGTEEPPGRYRILAPYAFDGLTRLTRLAPGDAWFLFRWLCLFATLLAGHLYFRTWFEIGPAFAGNLLMAALLPLTFTNAWAHPDHLMELFLFTMACACLARGWNWGFAAALVLNALNRETSAFLVLLYSLARPIDRRHAGWSAGLAALWLMISMALRWRLGFASYNPWQARQNLEFLALLPAAYDPYYRVFAWFVALLIAPLLWLIARTWPIQTRLSKVAAAIVTPAFLLVAFLFSSIIETRIFTPLLPLLIPAALTALFPHRSSTGDPS
jgi:hypothetical protein